MLREQHFCQATSNGYGMCLHMVGAPGFEPEIGRLKVCCDTVSPHPRYLITLVTTHDSSPFVKIKIARDLTRQGRV